MKRFTEMINDALTRVAEIMPWDLVDRLAANPEVILLDVREPGEFETLHIAGSINVPRGVLETACEWGYDNTVVTLVEGREREVVVICRSGNRSVLAADVMQQMGFAHVASLKLGVRGWNEFDQPLVDGSGNPVEAEAADQRLASRVEPAQLGPGNRQASA